MKIAICDDCQQDRATIRDWLEQYCTAFNYQCEITEACSGNQLCACPDIAEFDAVFMDIFMTGLNGLETAEKLRTLGFSGAYIFSTSSMDHVFQSFAFDVVDYLVKPLAHPRFVQAVDKLFRVRSDAMRSIPLSIDGAVRNIELNRIYSVETDLNHRTLIHMNKSTVQCATLISEIGRLLEPYPNFLRCHRSYIINLNYVSGTSGATVYLKNGETVMLPVREAAEKRRQINEYLWMNMMEE